MMMMSERLMPSRLGFDGAQAAPAGHECAAMAARARQAKVLDRWAALQARGIITTIERQAHEAELSALTTNVRASSLIQMWRGLEADGGTPTTSHASAACEDAVWDSDVPRSEESEGESKGGRRKVVVRCGAMDVAARADMEMKAELEKLAGARPVSRFAHRKRIQTFLRFRPLRGDAADRDQRRSTAAARELDQLQRGFTVLTLRQRFNPGNQQGCDTTNYPMQVSSDDKYLSFEEHLDIAGDFVIPPPEEHPPHSESEYSHEDPTHDVVGSYDLREGSQNSDTVWEEEGSMEMSNIDWARPVGSPNCALSDHNEDMPMVPSPFPSPNWEIRRQAMYYDLLETYSDNAELRELLERRTVSNYLASDFRVTLDRLIMSAMQKQSSVDGRSELDEYEALEYEGGNQDGPSFSLVPVTFHPDQSSLAMQESYNSSHDLHEHDEIHQLRCDLARLNSEVRELRQLFQSCMEKQDRFQSSIKQEVATVLHSLVGAEDSTKSAARKGQCCICCKNKIDSLLYRCGHMCACFSCASELQWNNGRCPVCRAAIADVVRASLIQ